MTTILTADTEPINDPDSWAMHRVTRHIIDLREEPNLPYVILLPDGSETTPRKLVTRLLSLEERVETLEARRGDNKHHLDPSITPTTTGSHAQYNATSLDESGETKKGV